MCGVAGTRVIYGSNSGLRKIGQLRGHTRAGCESVCCRYCFAVDGSGPDRRNGCSSQSPAKTRAEVRGRCCARRAGARTPPRIAFSTRAHFHFKNLTSARATGKFPFFFL